MLDDEALRLNGERCERGCRAAGGRSGPGGDQVALGKVLNEFRILEFRDIDLRANRPFLGRKTLEGNLLRYSEGCCDDRAQGRVAEDLIDRRDRSGALAEAERVGQAGRGRIE